MASNKHTGMPGQSSADKTSAAKPRVNISIHPRRPRLVDLGIKLPKDSDGAFRATGRKDGKIFNLRSGSGDINDLRGMKKEDGTPSSYVSD
jgi:hypothetical protein